MIISEAAGKFTQNTQRRHYVFSNVFFFCSWDIFKATLSGISDLQNGVYDVLRTAMRVLRQQQFRAAYSIFPVGAFAKNLFIAYFFKAIIGGRNAADFYCCFSCSRRLCAELLFFIAFRRQRFSHSRRVRIIKLLQLFPIGFDGLSVVFVAESAVVKVRPNLRPHRLSVR